MKRLIIMVFALVSTLSFGQNWTYNALNNGGLGNILGTSSPHPINIFTNNIQRAQFTTGTILGVTTNIPGVGTGDGLRIINATSTVCGGNTNALGTLDMWTSCGTGSNIRWGVSGQISGMNNRFENWARLQGFFFNTGDVNGVYKFARSGKVTGFVGTNDFWRIGEQADGSNFNANRRLEVLDNVAQFRISYANPNTQSSIFTDFFTNNS